MRILQNKMAVAILSAYINTNFVDNFARYLKQFVQIDVISFLYYKIQSMKVHIQTLNNAIYTLECQPNDSIQSLKAKLQDASGIAIAQHRLVFSNHQLEDNQTLAFYNIQNQSTIFLILKLRDIGTFDQHFDSPGRKYLLNYDPNHVDNTEIQELISKLNVNPTQTFTQIKLQVSELALKKVIQYADKKYQEAIQRNLVQQEFEDLKITIEKSTLVQMIGESLFQQLESLMENAYQQIIIRRCQAHGKLINFHTDVSLRTLQLSLNSDEEYEGGKLVYIKGQKLMIPKRSAGAVTIHSNKIAHGVSLLEKGVRYGLFMIKKQ